MNEKRCTKCKQVKSFDEFYKDEKHKDGLASWCKLCNRTGVAESKLNKTSVGNPANPKALEILEKLARIKLCKDGICPECKVPKLTPRPWRRPDDNIAYICSWCETEYDKNGKMLDIKKGDE